ncbi:Cas1p-domain-containing protein [Hesseltinella vesiculosa]|uniref:Cas1p-domain-containing protein n=1 Tax=Hesseltinella vesiculosa TaxID=101127 RepID=A0A1X2G5I0_9FUNG|nr:Cas1p-domain-containing protein [Hesseltinella vesiculosa]
MVHNYQPLEISSCLNHSRVLYIGDSIMREQFYSMNRLTHAFDIKGPLHVDRKYKSEEFGMLYEFWWDPYINQTRTLDLLSGNDTTGDPPSLLVIGSGIWYTRRLSEDVYLEQWKTAVDRVFDGVEANPRMADTVMLSPVELPQFNLLNPVRQKLITIDKITTMNNYLKQRADRVKPQVPFAVAFTWNAIATSTLNQTEDGLHFNTNVTLPQAQMALNFRCNQLLPKHYPINTTCCIHYPVPQWYQLVFFLFFLIWIPLGFGLLQSSSSWCQRYIPSDEKVLTANFIMGLGVLYMYIGDRTQLFAKMHKQFDADTFCLQMLLMVVAGVVSLRYQSDVDDLGLLNRGQTDEWKGWMQLVILIYHFTGASGTAGIYNAVRSLVAAYLFQTGYGHFYFFYKKKDFGIKRVLNVLVRLNLLTFILMYVMNTDYLSYYFTPLVSFWFLVIWLVMFVGHDLNEHGWFLLAKMAIACVLTTLLIHLPGVLELLFDVLAFVGNIHWQAAEWRFRLSLDAFVVYVGMLFAWATIAYKDQKWGEKVFFRWAHYCYLPLGALVLAWYFWFELQQPSKAVYNQYHPFVSWIPILAYIGLRNGSVYLRNINSRLFMWVGKCSLETFIGQFHMWLAADTKGLLVVVPPDLVERLSSGSGWWLNWALSSLIFLYICHYLAQATNTLTAWIVGLWTYQPDNGSSVNSTGSSTNHPDNYLAVPLLPTHHNSPDEEKQPDEKEDDTRLLAEEDEDSLSLEEEMELWQQPPPSTFQRIVNFIRYDPRIKTFVFFIGMLALNHFC